MKEYIPQIRIISVEHDLTMEAAQRLKQAMDQDGLSYPVLSVYCHLEASRCGIASGRVAVEVDGNIIWSGERVTEKLAASFCRGLRVFVQQQKDAYGMA